MKALIKNLKYFCIFSVLSGGLLASCVELDVPAPTVMGDDAVFSNENSVIIYLARMYSLMPFEEFKYSPNRQFFDDWLAIPDQCSGQCVNRDFASFMTVEGNSRNGPYWGRAFNLIREANWLLKIIPDYQDNFNESFYSHLLGEAYFARAMTFYALAKRYGGIPLVTEIIEYPQEIEALERPRSTEEETWNQVLTDFNEAVKYLSENSPRRGLANKNLALAFKAEAMLYAGSIAKYNGTNTGFGRKTNVRVIGFDPATAAAASKKYFLEAYNASREIMKKNRYALYKRAWSPTDKEMQFQNMVDMFFDANSEENIYIKEYSIPNMVHGYDVYAVPLQLRGSGYSCNASPILDFVELYDGFPKNPDGTIKVFDKDNSDPTRKYTLYDNPYDLFKDAEPRLRAYVVFPYDKLKNQVIEIRRGIYVGDVTDGIAPLMVQNGVEVYNVKPSVGYANVDAALGKGAFEKPNPPDGPITNHPYDPNSEARRYLRDQVLFLCIHGDNNRSPVRLTWAGQTQPGTYNASGASGPFQDALGANGGFTMRKWIVPDRPTSAVIEGRCTQHFVVMRYAQVMLTAAEAACELALAGESAPSGDNFQEIATNVIREIRERAGADPLVGNLTLNEEGKMLIRKERQKELAYENKNLWDIRRWRTQHSDVVNGDQAQDGIYYRGLYPFYAEKAGKFFFDVRYLEQNWRFRLGVNDYYLGIPNDEVAKSTVIDQQPFR